MHQNTLIIKYREGHTNFSFALMSMPKAKTKLSHTAAAGTLNRRTLVMRGLPMQWDRANITNTMEDSGVVSTSVHQVTYG